MIRKAAIADVNQLAKIHVDTWQSTYRGIIPDDYLNNLTYHKSIEMFHNIITNHINNHLVIEYHHKIVGFVSFGAERTGNYPYKGEIQAIYILNDYQGLGLGKQLFQETLHQLINKGFSNLMLWALEDNPYTDFYKKLGGKIIDYKDITIGSKTLKEVAFAWDVLEQTL